VEHADAIEYLSDAQAESLGGIFAAQFIEHLAPRGIVEFLAAARRALRPDGIAIIETINPQSLFALANWYFMDLTHAQPVHPMTLRFLAEQEGFRDIEIRYRAPVREEPPTVELSDDAPAWAKSMATSVASELQRIDEVVFGPQDYAIVLRTPA
jgi:O-antigen chain-terminating methyltransferase